MADPISRVEIVTSGANFNQAWNVTVAEGDQLYGRVCGEGLASKGLKLLSSRRPGIRISMPGLCAADELGQGTRPIGMNMTERRAGHSASDDSLEHAVTEVSITEPVTMRQVGESATDTGRDRTFDQFDAYLIGEERSSPGIMVPTDEPHSNAGIDQVCERLEGSEVFTKHNRAIFKPEIEQVAIDDKFTGDPGYKRKEIVKSRFAGFWSGAKVGVRNDNALKLTHGHQYTEVR